MGASSPASTKSAIPTSRSHPARNHAGVYEPEHPASARVNGDASGGPDAQPRDATSRRADENSDDLTTTLNSQSGLALELTGGLPCVRCTYNLRGLSVRGLCPECGTPIRATILARVDPLARELQPVYTPRLTAGCMVLWAIAALGAAIASWVPRVIEVINAAGNAVRPPAWPIYAVVACLTLSGFGALALVRPHGRMPQRNGWLALLACILYIPLAIVLFHIATQFDARNPRPYLGVGVDAARPAWRLCADCLIIAIIIGLRPSARMLAARSFVLRTGRVDRQTMLAMAAAVGVCALGDALALAVGLSTATTQGPGAATLDVLRMASTLCVGVGSLLVTLGLASVVIDVIRMVPVIAAPPLALADITGPSHEDRRPEEPPAGAGG